MMNKVWLAVVTLIALGSFGFTMAYVKKQSPKIAYIELEAIYNDFQMKKELEGKLENVQQARKTILDSLKIQVSLLSKSIKSDKEKDKIRAFELKRQEYLMKEQNFTQSNQETSQQYTSQIWKQLNQYLREYGSRNEYTYLLGYDGNSGGAAVIYGSEPQNVTVDVKKFVNERYKGSK
jgi:outer membrane protein